MYDSDQEKKDTYEVEEQIYLQCAGGGENKSSSES